MIVRVDGQHLSAQIDYPNPQRLVSGNPQRRTWPQRLRACGRGQ
jgi:hypothetical protein